MRKRYVQDPVTFDLIPIEEYQSRSPVGPFVMPDISPYKSMQTGEIIQGRRQHREHLKQHRLVEIGNEIGHHMKKQEPKIDRAGVKRALIDAVNRHMR